MCENDPNIKAYNKQVKLNLDIDADSKEGNGRETEQSRANSTTDVTEAAIANGHTDDISESSHVLGVASGPRAPVTTGSAAMVCRICQSNGCSHHESLISPCNCKGSMAYVHLSCLERWLNQSSRTHCELCMFRFNSIRTQRYGMVESLKVWLRHPQNRPHFQSDMLIGTILTLVTIGLISVCLLGVQYFVFELRKYGIPRILTLVIIGSFLMVVFVGYILTIYFLLRDQLQPWYRWWRRTMNIKVLLSPSMKLGGKKEYLSNHRVADAINFNQV